MKRNIGNAIVLSVVAMLVLSVPALAVVNNWPVPVPKIKPDKIYECEGPVIMDGSGSYDIDGGSLRYEWLRNGIKIAEGKTVQVGKEITDNAGTYAFTLNVTDSGGASASKDADLSVISNPRPYIEELEYTATSPEELEDRDYLTAGDIFELEAVKGSSNHGENYTWSFNEQVLRMKGSGNVVKFEVISQSAQGKYKIEVTAKNACGEKSASKEKEFEIRPLSQNSPPAPEIEMPSVVYEGRQFVLSSKKSKTGQGFFESGDKIVKQRWEIRNSAGIVVVRSNSENASVTIENSGVFIAHLWVTDSFGAVGYSNESFPVFETENDPSVANASATEKIAIHGKVHIMNASFSSDPDGPFKDAIKRIEFWDMTYDQKNPDKLCSSTTKSTCEVVFYRTGIHTIQLRVFDAGVMDDPKTSDIKINVVASGEDKKNASSDGQIVSSEDNIGTVPRENAVDPEEVLRNSSKPKENVPEDAKPAPAPEAILVIFALTAIARRLKN